MTTRQGGVSQYPYDALNLGDHVGDVPQAVAANRLILQKQLGVRPVFLKQVHGSRCIQIDASTPDGLEADACVTMSKDVACTIMVADCLPVLFWNESGTAVGAAHAGWRGLVGAGGVDVLEATIHALRGLSQPREALHTWLGPCIGFDQFEVGAEVARYFETAFKRQVLPDQWRVDLAGAARHRLTTLGVATLSGNDGLPYWCTVTNQGDFFSHRRDSKLSGNSSRMTGRMAASIFLKDEP